MEPCARTAPQPRTGPPTTGSAARRVRGSRPYRRAVGHPHGTMIVMTDYLPSAADGSSLSLWSTRSFLSIGSAGSVLSIGSVGSVLSIGSIGSSLSVGSIGSAMSMLSVASLQSTGSVMSVQARWSFLAADPKRVLRSPGSLTVLATSGLALAGALALRTRARR